VLSESQIYFCSDYDSQDHSAVEVKQEIEKHLAKKEILENTIPSMIVIGPFQINTETVRQKLATKRKALANQVIELLAKKLRKQNEEVCLRCFERISPGLNIPGTRGKISHLVHT
jgi:dynein heavy chain